MQTIANVLYFLTWHDSKLLKSAFKTRLYYLSPCRNGFLLILLLEKIACLCLSTEFTQQCEKIQPRRQMLCRTNTPIMQDTSRHVEGTEHKPCCGSKMSECWTINFSRMSICKWHENLTNKACI